MEQWIHDFENEEINDERWSCLVSAVVESKPDDEEYLKVLTQFVTIKAPIIRTISMLDVIALFKAPAEDKKKTEAKVKTKPKLDNTDESTLFTPPPPRFPEIVPYLSKYAVISDGACKLTPMLMAYAIKYLVLCLKDEDYFQRKVMRAARRQTIEAEVKAEVLKIMKEAPQEKVNVNDGQTSELWRKTRFDIFGDPLKDGPFYGPEMYIVLLDFYDPFIFPELQRLNVPFRAVIKIENFHPSSGNTVSGSKKSDLINNFWSLLEENTEMDDIALLKYVVPLTDRENFKEMCPDSATSLISILYSLFNICRLHHVFIQQMKVHRMTESLELLNLSKCVLYNELCDALVVEDQNVEIYILFSMIEQVAAGIPETGHTALEDITKTTSFLRNEEVFQESAPEKHQPDNLQREKRPSRRTAAVFFHDDKISLAALSIDPLILKPSEIFERFIINSISSKIRKKFGSLTPALKVQSDFSFYQMWVNSKENKEVFRVKLFFLIIMRLIERIRTFDIDCDDISSDSEVILSPSENSEERERSSEEIQDQSYNLNLSEINDLFYKELNIEKKCKNTSSTATRKVRKADAILVLGEKSTSSVENLDMACGRCSKMYIHEEPADHEVPVKKLEQFLESREITHLNDPNLLANRAEFEDFVKKHNFYETFEPNRTVQKLQQLSDEHNTIEYTYFTPTDTLFVLAYDDTDLRGIYHSLEGGFVMSPLPLRHFVRYVIPESKKWVAAENKKYIKFLKEIERKISDEERRRMHELRCEFLKKYKGMTNSGRMENRTEEGMGNRLNTKKGTGKNLEETQDPYLEDLPVKISQRQPEIKFFGIDSGETRMQVNVDNYEFHSRDGTTVGVKTQSWLHLDTVVTLTIQKLNCRLIVHRWTEGLEKRQMLFRDPSGIMVTFGMDFRPFPVRITQPNGLVIEIIKAGVRHIKQTYIKPYRWGEHITKEECRYCLYDGKVLIFRVDKAIDVLCPSGTKYTCYRMESGEIEVFNILTPTGELWIRDDCSKCKPAKKTMTVITGVDNETKEIYCKREDGTTCMLWPDGKLVTTYPDGTKITTTPKFEEENLINEREERDNVTSTETDKPYNCFGEHQFPKGDNGFTIISCSYLMEHPNYGTVYSEPSGLEIRILGKMKVVMCSTECLRIECQHTILKASSQSAKFFTFCRNCRKRSLSTVFFESDNLLSKSKDYHDQRFYVYCSGRILHKKEKENKTGEEELKKYGESKPSGETNCEYHKCCKSQRRCLAIEKDLTGLEFIDADTFGLYNGSLSQDAYYDLGRLSADKTQLQHAFFNPVYRAGREKYIMKYEKNDGFPNRLTRNNLKGGCDMKSVINSGRKPERRELPKAIVARFIQVLLPDPITVMKDITKEIAIHRKRSFGLSNQYGKISKKGKQGPFAKYIAKELELIASTLCPSLKLYPHTCSLTPYTEMDIHSTAHNFERNIFFMESNPDDCQRESLPRCKRIPKPLRHKKNDENIPEVAVLEDDDSTTSIGESS